ncbi:hypothetical protein [Streptomyces sp. AC495_CC817]|uniref:hypothetical protein n=1 Tax=Streptomyces sp. AC495_CC817 TaxID=2823900 RepID=UPI001C2681E2|nr:hypothetical protein [Streptomyces sp. AC495_CC817]
MADKTPNFTLTPQDAAWGRFVTSSIEELRRDRDRADLELTATNRGVGASVQSLSEQIRDLTGRVSYAADGTGTSQVWTTPTTTPYTWGPTLSFTLTEERVVSVQALIRIEAYVQANNTSSAAFAWIQSALFVNDVLVSGARGDIGTNVGVRPDSNRGNFAQGTAVARSLVKLPAGTHSVVGGFFERNAVVSGSPASGSASVTAKDPFIFVDVFQTTGA